MGKNKKIITISVSEDDLEKIDNYCVCHAYTRSYFFLQCAIEKILVEELAENMAEFNNYCKRVKNGYELSDEDLAVFETARKYLGVNVSNGK